MSGARTHTAVSVTNRSTQLYLNGATELPQSALYCNNTEKLNNHVWKSTVLIL